MTTYELGQILYRASVNPDAGRLRTLRTPVDVEDSSDPRIHFDEFIVVKVTPKGAWVTSYLRPHELVVHQGDSFERRWVPLDGKFCSATKEDAMHRLRARTRSYVRHARRRLRDAEARAEVLGIKVPESFLPSRWSYWDEAY